MPVSTKARRCGKTSSPSQALPRQLSQRESQAVRLIAKVLSVMRKFPAVLLPLPLRKDFPRSGGRCRAATKGGAWHRAAMTERAHATSPVAKISNVTRNFTAMPKAPPFGGAGCERSEQTERVLFQNSPSGRQISCLGTFAHAKSGTRLSGVRGAGSGCKP